MSKLMRGDGFAAALACRPDAAGFLDLPAILAAVAALRAAFAALPSFAAQRLASAPAEARIHPAEGFASAERQPATDDAGFGRLVVPQIDAAYNFARFLSRDPDGAHDIVQDAFLRAYRSFGSFGGGNAKAWLFAIVRNCHRDWQAERRRTARVEVEPDRDDRDGSAVDNIPSGEDTPEAALLRKSEQQRVRHILLSLPEPSREILVLRELEELSYREIAEVAALPIGTVMSRLARARREFAAEWTRDELPAGDVR